MTWRKRQEHVMDGDIVEPSEWRINMNEFASEFNGFLDNDNFFNHSLKSEQVKRDTFTQVLVNQEFSQYGYVFSHLQSGWTDRADWKVEESAETRWDGLAEGHPTGGLYSGSFDFGTVYPTWLGKWPTKAEDPNSPIINRAEVSDADNNTQLPYHSFSTETDALVTVDFHGTVSWLTGMGSLNDPTSFAQNMFHRHTGGSAWSDGKNHFTTTGQAYYRPDGVRYRQKNARVLCSMWRIVLDGMIVAETGPIGCEMQHHPIYLCGAIPVSSGKHRIELQAQFVWYVPGTGKIIQSASSNPEYEIDDTVVKLRQDCELRWPNLITQIRSR